MWATITLTESSTYDLSGRIWKRNQSIRTNDLTTIKDCQANSRFLVSIEKTPEKIPLKPELENIDVPKAPKRVKAKGRKKTKVKKK